MKLLFYKPINKFWSNACITPGTKFMEKLHSKLLDYAEDIKKLNKKIIVFLWEGRF